MRSYVLDTHTLVWYLAEPRRLGRAAARVLTSVDRGRGTAVIPAILAVELALLAERGRVEIGVADLEETLERSPSLQILPLDLRQAREFAVLPGIRDPFDRMIVAAARTLGCPVVSADHEIAECGLVTVVWD